MSFPEETAGQPGTRVDSTNTRQKGWWVHLLLIGSYPLMAGLLSFSRMDTRMPALTHNSSGLLRVCAFQIGVFSVIFMLSWLGSHVSSKELLLTWRPRFWSVPLGIGYSVGLRLALGVIGVFIVLLLLALHVVKSDDLEKISGLTRPDVESLVDVTALRNDPVYLWLNLTLVSLVVAGLREELWRSAFLAGLKHLWPRIFATRPGQIAAVGVAAAIFGCGHVAQGGAGVAAAGLLGFGLGSIMVLHQSIWPAVIAHGLFDATTFGLLMLFSNAAHVIR